MGVYYRVLCFGMGMHLCGCTDDSDGDIQMIQYLNHARENKQDVQIETKRGIMFGKIEKIWWDDLDDVVILISDTGKRKQFTVREIINLEFL